MARRRSVRLPPPEGDECVPRPPAHGPHPPPSARASLHGHPPAERSRTAPLRPLRGRVPPPPTAPQDRHRQGATTHAATPPTGRTSRAPRAPIPTPFRAGLDMPPLPVSTASRARTDASASSSSSSSSSSAPVRLQPHTPDLRTPAGAARTPASGFNSTSSPRDSPRDTPRLTRFNPHSEDVLAPNRPEHVSADADRTWPPSGKTALARSMTVKERGERYRQPLARTSLPPQESARPLSFPRAPLPTSQPLARTPSAPGGTPGLPAGLPKDVSEGLHVHNLAEALRRVRLTASEGTVHTAVQLVENVGRMNALLREARDELVQWGVESDMGAPDEGDRDRRRKELATTLNRLVGWSDDQTRLVTQTLLLLPPASQPCSPPSPPQPRESSWRVRLRERQASAAHPAERTHTRARSKTYHDNGLGLGL